MYASLLGGYPIGTTLLPYRQIADERRARQQYAHSAVAGVAHQNGHFPFTLPIVAILLREGSIRVGKYSSSPRTLGAFWQKSSNRRGWQIHSRPLLRQAT